MLGVIYSQGIYIDIEESIHHYNYGFDIRNDYSENNLGIIYMIVNTKVILFAKVIN